MRDKILSSKLEVDKCDYKDIHEFSKSLKRTNKDNGVGNSSKEVKEEKHIVNYLYQAYSAHKCSLQSKFITKILLLSWNTLFKKGWCLWR